MKVIIAHETLDPQALLGILVTTKGLGDLWLQVPGQHVVLVAGQEVKLVTYAPEKGQGGVGGGPLARGDETFVG